MSCFMLPKKFSDHLNFYTRNFRWGGDPEYRGIHWASWAKLSLTKSHGGMGFRDFRAFNLALLAKQAWRLFKFPNSLCAQLLKGIYFPSSDFLSAGRGRRASWAWSSILQGRDLLRKGLRWQVGNDQSINFWEDRWIPSSSNFKPVSLKPDGCQVQWVGDVINSTHAVWDRDKLLGIINHKDVSNISVIPVSSEGQADTLI
ncbi:uncharacterized protein LOC114298319 [Camellia sinensis]|uniref:uncharacterized protein LOC114298319 n=1 Tax=Camellia sinensis TaxID=4442 RepID=UPI001035B26A|nr:uncharacterized protein LOC114298319 [Camellia sinensis]